MSAAELRMTPKILNALEALDAANDKALTVSRLRVASGCRARFFGILLARLDRAQLVTRDVDRILLTFAGMRALARHHATREGVAS